MTIIKKSGNLLRTMVGIDRMGTNPRQKASFKIRLWIFAIHVEMKSPMML